MFLLLKTRKLIQISVGKEKSKQPHSDSVPEHKERFMADLAIEKLSFTEMIAVQAMIKELTSQEGVIMARKIADDIGITRSTFAGALGKLESANIVHTRSLGMKGTHVQIINPELLAILNERDHKPHYA